MSDHARIVDLPSMFGFFSVTNSGNWKWHPYIMGGAPDAPGDAGDPPPAGDGEGGEKKDPPEPKPDATAGDDADGKKFTQEDVNALIAKEVSKASRGKIDPKELGFESAKDMKEALDKMKEDQEAKKTEQEKALEAAIAQATEEAKAGVLSTANARVVKAEFLIAAREAGVPKEALGDAYVLAQAHADWNVEVSDDGVVSGLDEDFFNTLKKDKPFLFSEGGNPPPGDVGAGARGGGSTKNRTDELKGKYPALKQLT